MAFLYVWRSGIIAFKTGTGSLMSLPILLRIISNMVTVLIKMTVYVDEDDEVSLAGPEMTSDESNFHSIINLLDLSGSVPQINYEAIQD